MKEIAEHFDTRARMFGRTVRACDYRSRWSFLQRQQLVIKMLKEAKDKKVLDVGCGPGLFTELIASRNYLVGVDLSLQMLQLASGRLRPVLADGQFLPFVSGAFDDVVVIETLQHLEKPTLLLTEACRMVRQGGQLIVSALNKTSALHKFFVEYGGYSGLYFHDLEYVQSILKRESFADIETMFLGFPMPLVWKARNAWQPMASSWMIHARKEAQ